MKTAKGSATGDAKAVKPIGDAHNKIQKNWVGIHS